MNVSKLTIEKEPCGYIWSCKTKSQMTMKRYTPVFILLLFAFTTSVEAQSHYYTNEEGVAVKGYDVVSYFKGDEPRKGSEAHSLEHDGVTFHFASKANKKAFQKNPGKYLPEYGGYCAFAVGKKAKKVPADPETYTITDGNLYLFFNGNMNGKKMNTKPMWDQHEEQLQPKAEQNWQEMM